MLAGCASIVSHGNPPVGFVSRPPGAQATIQDERALLVHQQLTPFQVDLDAHDGFFDPAEYRVRFEKACYEPVEVLFEASIDGWYFGNILFGGLIGMLIVDPATGDMWQIDEDIAVELKPLSQCTEAAAQQPAAVPAPESAP